MPINERGRIRFHGWLLQHDLDEEVADAILATMPPYDWNELVTKTDLAALEQRVVDRFAIVESHFAGMGLRLDQVDRRFDYMEGQFEARFGHVDNRLDRLDERMAGVSTEIRAIVLMLVALVASAVVAGVAALFG